MYKTKINYSRTDLGVATSSNVANAYTNIFVVTVPKGVRYRLYNETPFIIKLYDSAGTQIAANSKLILAAQKPGDRLPREICEFDYRPFYTLTEAEQNNVNYQERTKVVMPYPVVTFNQDEKIVIQLNSSSVVDWTQADTAFEFEVEESAIS
jgi:hypothetical protein